MKKILFILILLFTINIAFALVDKSDIFSVEDPWIGNSIIGMDISEYGSPEGAAILQYPIGTEQGYLETYWLRYNNSNYYGYWPWHVANSQQVISADPMEYTINTEDKKEAYGKVNAGLLGISMTATSLKGKPWVRVIYTIENDNDFAIENIRFYQFADIDVGETPFGGASPENRDDSTKFNADYNAVYIIDHIDGTPDSYAETEDDEELWLLGIMSPLQSEHHDVYGGPNPHWPYPYANPAYYHCQDGYMNDEDYFYGDGGMTMEWIFGLEPKESFSIPVYFFGLLKEEEIPSARVSVLCDSTEWKNHGQYTSCVAHEAEKLLEKGLITEEEKDAIVSEAARSDIGKKTSAGRKN